MSAAKHQHNNEERRLILERLALNSGNVDRTMGEFEEDENEGGTPAPSKRTLYYWKKTPEYESIRDQLEKPRDEAQAERLSAVVDARLDLMDALEAAAQDAIKDKKWNAVRDILTADRNAATSMGIGNQNSRLNREKPLGILAQEHRVSMPAIEAGLQALGVLPPAGQETIPEATAREIDSDDD